MAWYGNLCQLEGDLARMAHHTCPDLDKAALDAGERPVGYVFGQVGMLEEAAKIIGQGMKLKPHLIISEPLAG